MSKAPNNFLNDLDKELLIQNIKFESLACPALLREKIDKKETLSVEEILIPLIAEAINVEMLTPAFVRKCGFKSEKGFQSFLRAPEIAKAIWTNNSEQLLLAEPLFKKIEHLMIKPYLKETSLIKKFKESLTTEEEQALRLLYESKFSSHFSTPELFLSEPSSTLGGFLSDVAYHQKYLRQIKNLVLFKPTPLSEKDLIELFLEKHRELLNRDNAKFCGLYSLFSKTKVRHAGVGMNTMTLQEIIEHAQKGNRSTEACASLGWMDAKGHILEEAPELIKQLVQQPSAKMS